MGVRDGSGVRPFDLRVLLEQLCVPEPLRKQHYVPGLEFCRRAGLEALASRKTLAIPPQVLWPPVSARVHHHE